MFMTPGALELVRFLAGSLLVSVGDEERPLTAESTLEISDVSADMMAVLWDGELRWTVSMWCQCSCRVRSFRGSAWTRLRQEVVVKSGRYGISLTLCEAENPRVWCCRRYKEEEDSQSGVRRDAGSDE